MGQGQGLVTIFFANQPGG